MPVPEFSFLAKFIWSVGLGSRFVTIIVTEITALEVIKNNRVSPGCFFMLWYYFIFIDDLVSDIFDSVPVDSGVVTFGIYCGELYLSIDESIAGQGREYIWIHRYKIIS